MERYLQRLYERGPNGSQFLSVLPLRSIRLNSDDVYGTADGGPTSFILFGRLERGMSVLLHNIVCFHILLMYFCFPLLQPCFLFSPVIQRPDVDSGGWLTLTHERNFAITTILFDNQIRLLDGIILRDSPIVCIV